MVRTMTKKLFLCIGLVSTQSTLFASENSLGDRGQKMKKDFDEYKLSAYWIPDELYACNPDDAYKVLSEVIRRLTDKNRLDLYFGETRPISKGDLWRRISWQCQQLNLFFETTYVDVKTKKLKRISLESQILDQNATQGYMSFYEYGECYCPDEFSAISDFYCVYLDASFWMLGSSLEQDEEIFMNEIDYCARILFEKVKDSKKFARYRQALLNFRDIGIDKRQRKQS